MPPRRVGLETLLAVALRLYHNGDLPLLRLTEVLSPIRQALRPARRNAVARQPADLIVVDLDAPWVVQESRLRSRRRTPALKARACRARSCKRWLRAAQCFHNGGLTWRIRSIGRAIAALYVAAIIFGYLLGSIPFGLLITRIAGMGDVRKIGSGNIGATNVLRTGNKETRRADACCSTCAQGHRRRADRRHVGAGPRDCRRFCRLHRPPVPVWLGFKGGKGVATYLGVLLGLAWPAALVFAVVWLAVAYLSKYSSLAALVAAVAVPVYLFWSGPAAVAWLFTAMSIIVFAKHHANIRRLLDGNESRIGAKG
jgi:glycerol-3-phosphate acyltransferase PlsY